MKRSEEPTSHHRRRPILRSPARYGRIAPEARKGLERVREMVGLMRRFVTEADPSHFEKAHELASSDRGSLTSVTYYRVMRRSAKLSFAVCAGD